jgi:hypothetical protein
VSNYQIGAFEALEWAWHMLRSHANRSKAIEAARREIFEILSEMGGGRQINFEKKIKTPSQ